jgi:hypothetical protein
MNCYAKLVILPLCLAVTAGGAACTITSASTSPADASTTGADSGSSTGFDSGSSSSTEAGALGDGGPGAGAPQNCTQVLQCIGACPTSDASCPDACLGHGSPDAQRVVVALAKCMNDNACADANCVKAHCISELQSCAEQSSAPSGAPIEGGAPPATGSVPANLVGQWMGSSTSGGDVLDINADGTMHWLSVIETDYMCTTKMTLDRGGIVDVSGDQLVVYYAVGTGTSIMCGGEPTVSPTSAVTRTWRWEIGTGTTGKTALSLWDIPAGKYPAFYLVLQ